MVVSDRRDRNIETISEIKGAEAKQSEIPIDAAHHGHPSAIMPGMDIPRVNAAFNGNIIYKNRGVSIAMSNFDSSGRLPETKPRIMTGRPLIEPR